MKNASAPHEAKNNTTYAPPPAMPSIAASALMESRQLLEVTRRTIAALLLR
jgi:hypothetical protein